jgi:hypothetical protein
MEHDQMGKDRGIDSLGFDTYYDWKNFRGCLPDESIKMICTGRL